MIFKRELDVADPARHLAHHVVQRPTADIGIDIDAPGDSFPTDNAVGLPDPNMRNVAQANLLVFLGVDHQPLDVVEVVADFRRAPDHDIEHLLFLEQSADCDAADQCRSGAANVSRLQAVAAGPIQIDLDLESRLGRRLFDAGVLDALDLFEDPPDLLGLRLDDFELVAIDADCEGLLASGQRLSHLLRKVGLHLAGHAD